MKHSIRISILMVIAIISTSNLFAATRTWTGNTSTAFATNTNWSNNTAPAAGDDVIIPASVTSNRWPAVGANTPALLSITLNGGTLTGNSNISATTITINGGTFTRGTGTLTATTINLSGGTINLSNRTLSTLTYTSGTLTMTNGATVTTFNMDGGTFTNGTVQMTIGTLNANGGTFTRGSGTFALTNLRLNGGTYTNGSSALSVSGTLTLESGSYGNGTFNLTVGTLLLNGGTFTRGSGTLTLTNLNLNGGTYTNGSSALTLTGTLTLGSGTFTNGTFNLSVGTLQLNAGTFTRGTGTFTCSNLTLNGGAYVNGSSNLSLSGTFTQESGTFTQGSYNLTTGLFILNGGTFNGSSGTITVNNGDMDINNGTFVAGSGNITLNDNNNADLIVASGATFTGGTGTVSNTSGGDFLIAGTATFAYNKLTVANGSKLEVEGEVDFTGTGDIILAGEVDILATGTLDLNNNDLVLGDRYYFRGGSVTNPGDTIKTVDFTIRGSFNVNLNYVLRVSGSTEIRDGAKLTTNDNDLIIFEHTATFSTSAGRFATDAQHIVGPVIVLMNSSNGTTSFTFPIGNGNVYAPITISNYGTRRTGDFFKATYFSSRNPNAGGSKANTLNLVSQAEYWILDRGALSGTATTTAAVTLSYNTGRSGSITNASLLRVAKWNGTQWVDEGRASTSSTTAASGSLISSANVTSFSPFTLGSTTNVNPLPVKLLDFTASAVASNVNVKWTTTSEINNDYFNVEKSLDGKNWSVIGTVKGAGNTEALTNYNFVDANPVMGMQYYRLQQNDINGDFTYSAIAPVNFTNAVTSQISIFPMPANNFINVELPGVSEMSVTIYNANGQKVFEATSGNLQTIDIQDFNAGLYIIEVKADNNVISSKFLKN